MGVACGPRPVTQGLVDDVTCRRDGEQAMGVACGPRPVTQGLVDDGS